MSLTATVGKERDLIEEGIFDGVCSKIIDLGTQYSEIFKNSAHKIRIFWEIVGETIEINGEQMPRLVSKEFTLSLNEKSKLRQALQSWRGKAFTAEELQGVRSEKGSRRGLPAPDHPQRGEQRNHLCQCGNHPGPPPWAERSGPQGDHMV